MSLCTGCSDEIGPSSPVFRGYGEENQRGVVTHCSVDTSEDNEVARNVFPSPF